MIKKRNLTLFLDLNTLEEIPKHHYDSIYTFLSDWINKPLDTHEPVGLDDLTIKRVDWIVWERGWVTEIINPLRTITLRIRNAIYSILGNTLPNGETIIREQALENTSIKRITASPDKHLLIITINTPLCQEQPKLEYCA